MRKQHPGIKIMKTSFPVTTWLNSILPVDYADTFKAEWSSDRHFSSEEMLIAVFCRLPAWLRLLYKVRNMLVKLLRITAETEVSKSSGGQSGFPTGELASAIRAGTSYSLFSVPFKTPSETVLIGKDRHLDFYFSIQTQLDGVDKQSLSATTLVRYNNATGRLYFFFVRPFHCLVVPMMMKGAIRAMEDTPWTAPA